MLEPTFDADGCLTEEFLEAVAHFDVLEHGVEPLLRAIKQAWRYPERGFRRRGRYLWLYTFGWSDNEAIIMALNRNLLFWGTSWQYSKVGGQYKFDLHKLLRLPKQPHAGRSG